MSATFTYQNAQTIIAAGGGGGGPGCAYACFALAAAVAVLGIILDMAAA